MIHKKKNRRVACILKEKFDFSSDREKSIYKYSIGANLSRYETKCLCEDKRFNTYTKWREYVEGKLRKYKINELIDYKHHLKFLAETMESINYVFWMLMSAILASIGTLFFEKLFSMPNEAGEGNSLFYTITLSVGSLVIAVLIVILVVTIISTKSKMNTEKLFYKEYISIINKVIKAKKQNNK